MSAPRTDKSGMTGGFRMQPQPAPIVRRAGTTVVDYCLRTNSTDLADLLKALKINAETVETGL